MDACNECEWWQLTSDPNWRVISPPRRGSPSPSVSQAGGASSQARGGDRGSGTRGASVVELSTKFREDFIVSLSASSCTYSGSAHFIKDIMADNRNDNHVVTITLADLNLCPGAYRYRVLIGSRCKN